MAGPTYLDVKSNNSTSGSHIDIDLPANPPGSIMIAFVKMAMGGDTPVFPTINTPTGWTHINGLAISNGFGRHDAFYRYGNDYTGAQRFTFSHAINVATGFIVSYDAPHSTTPIDSSLTQTSTLTGAHLTRAITTTVANCLIVAEWDTGDSGNTLSLASAMSERASQGGSSAQRTTLIADVIQAAIGSTGIKAATSNFNNNGSNIIIAIRPFEGPSNVTITYPNGNELITQGTTQRVTSSAATSPTAAQSTLKYLYQYSPNGIDWTNILGGDGLTAAGVHHADWNTTGLALGSAYKVRGRAYDPAAAAYSLRYDESNAAFSLVAETAPAAPTNLSPTSVQNKASTIRLAWVNSNELGNPQTEFTLQWSRDNFASHTATVTTATANAYHDIDLSGEADGAVISFKVKRRGLTLYSAYSSVASFTVASAPAAPSITAPTFASPPTSPTPTVTFTAGAFQKRRVRIEQSGSEVYPATEVASTATSFVSPYSFVNGLAYTLYLAVQNSFGLWSAEDSETFTPTFTGPAIPVLTIISVDEGGYNQISIANSDTVTKNQIWRYPADEGAGGPLLTESGDEILDESGLELETEVQGDSSLAILIADNVAEDGTFRDDNIESGQYFLYFVRAFNALGLTTDSLHSSAVVTLSYLHLHAVTKESTTSNVLGTAVALANPPSQEVSLTHHEARHKLAGRTRPQTVYGIATSRRESRSIIIPYTEANKLKDLLAIKRATRTGVACLRDQVGNKSFGKIGSLRITDEAALHRGSFEFLETKYVEALN